MSDKQRLVTMFYCPICKGPRESKRCEGCEVRARLAVCEAALQEIAVKHYLLGWAPASYIAREALKGKTNGNESEPDNGTD